MFPTITTRWWDQECRREVCWIFAARTDGHVSFAWERCELTRRRWKCFLLIWRWKFTFHMFRSSRFHRWHTLLKLCWTIIRNALKFLRDWWRICKRSELGFEGKVIYQLTNLLQQTRRSCPTSKIWIRSKDTLRFGRRRRW